MKIYERPEIEIVIFQVSDSIADIDTSVGEAVDKSVLEKKDMNQFGELK